MTFTGLSLYTHIYLYTIPTDSAVHFLRIHIYSVDFSVKSFMRTLRLMRTIFHVNRVIIVFSAQNKMLDELSGASTHAQHMHTFQYTEVGTFICTGTMSE